MGEPRAGRKLVISGDTAPCEMTRVAAHEAQLLVHDASFADAESERAEQTGHSTARQAAELAARRRGRAARARPHLLALRRRARCSTRAGRHSPARSRPRDFDLVEIPFPERGEPRHVEGGARQARDPRAADPSLAP